MLLPHCHLQADASLIRFFRFYVFFAVTVSAETRTMEAVFRLIDLSCSSLCTYSERENATKREKADRLRAQDTGASVREQSGFFGKTRKT